MTASSCSPSTPHPAASPSASAWPAESKSPRSFALDPTGAWLVCGNLTADNVSVFRIDPASGRLIATGRAVAVPQVSCVQFVEFAGP